MTKPIAVITLLALLSGCAHTVAINPYPGFASVKLDGLPLGKGSQTFSDMSGPGKSYSVEASAPGYASKTVVLNQEWNSSCIAGYVVLGLFTGFGFIGLLWCHELSRSNYDIPLDPSPTAPSAAATAQPGS